MAATNREARRLVLANGQFAFPAGLRERMGKPDWDFKLKPQGRFDFKDFLERASHVFEAGSIPISPAQLEDDFGGFRERLLALPGLANLSKNVILPGLMPPITNGSIGSSLMRIFMPAVERGFKAVYPDRTFHSGGNFMKQVLPKSNTGHERFCEPSDEWTLFVYVADCLRGWPVAAQYKALSKELIAAGLSLVGGYDGLSALALYPTVLAGNKCPGIDFSGIVLNFGVESLYAGANNDGLNVYANDNLDQAHGNYSGAVSFDGRCRPSVVAAETQKARFWRSVRGRAFFLFPVIGSKILVFT